MPMANETPTTPTVDMAAINAEIAQLPKEQLIAELTKVRTRQKTQQKKQYAKGTMKAYQQKAREKFKAMKEAALAAPATEPGFANLWEQINASAETQAEKNLEQIASESAGDEAETE